MLIKPSNWLKFLGDKVRLLGQGTFAHISKQNGAIIFETEA